MPCLRRRIAALPPCHIRRHTRAGSSTLTDPNEAGNPAIDAPEVREQVEAIYRAESRRVLATLIRLLGDFDLAEEALHDAFIAAVEQWPHEGVPDNPRAWLVSTGRFKAIDKIRRRAKFDVSLEDVAERIDELADPAAARGARRRRGRSPAPGLHLLPPGAGRRRPGGAHAARGVRPHHRGDRARLPRHALHHRAAHRAREEQDPRRAHPLRSAGAHRAARAAGQRAARGLPRLQRGLPRLLRATRSPATTSRARRFASGGCWSSCCPSPRRWDCSRSCCCTNRAASRAPRPRASWSCSPTRTARSGTARRSPTP